jgi:hypothetical protein
MATACLVDEAQRDLWTTLTGGYLTKQEHV